MRASAVGELSSQSANRCLLGAALHQGPEKSSEGNIFVKPVSVVKVEPSVEPWLKDFLDRVIIPALLREFMKSDLATSPGISAESHQETPGELE